MTGDRKQTKKAMVVLTVVMVVFLAIGIAVPLLMLRGAKTGALSFMCFPVTAVALASVRHVLRTIDLRLTALEEGRRDE
jgi:hypothetical protein